MIIPTKIMQACLRAYFGEAYSAQSPTQLESVREKLLPIITAAFEEAAKNETNLFFGSLTPYIRTIEMIAERPIHSWIGTNHISPYHSRLQVSLELPAECPDAKYFIEGIRNR